MDISTCFRIREKTLTTDVKSWQKIVGRIIYASKNYICFKNVGDDSYWKCQIMFGKWDIEMRKWLQVL